MSTAQSYPSLTASNPQGGASVGISTAAGAGPCLSQALTMSLTSPYFDLTSTSSDSEQVSLEVRKSQIFPSLLMQHVKIDCLLSYLPLTVPEILF